MRLLIAAAVFMLPPTASAADPQAMALSDIRSISTGKQCGDAKVRQAREPQAATPRNLGELPPGSLQLAVQREVDGCIEPVIVRYGVGAEAPRPRPRIFR